MKISLITATYNSLDTIPMCIESVASQDYKNIEHLIIDGESTDGTLEYVRKKSDELSTLRVLSGPDSGIYDALNKGISACCGDVIGFVHSDDFLACPDVLSKIVKSFNSPAVSGVYGDLQYVRKDNPGKVVRYWKSNTFKSRLLHRGWMPPHPTLFLKNGVYRKHGKFDLAYKIAADYAFMLRVFKDHDLRFVYLPEVIIKMRLGGASNRSLKNILLKSKEDLRAMRSNNLPMPLIALLWKNLSKLSQFSNR